MRISDGPNSAVYVAPPRRGRHARVPIDDFEDLEPPEDLADQLNLPADLADHINLDGELQAAHADLDENPADAGQVDAPEGPDVPNAPDAPENPSSHAESADDSGEGPDRGADSDLADETDWFEDIDELQDFDVSSYPEVPAVGEADEDYSPTDPSSVPLQPDLGRPLIAIVAVISALFGAALVLVLCLVLMRLFGL